MGIFRDEMDDSGFPDLYRMQLRSKNDVSSDVCQSKGKILTWFHIYQRGNKNIVGTVVPHL